MALLANTVATGAAFVALILTFGPISGAHFNPAVTLADASQGGLPWLEVPGYITAQVLGAFAGVGSANLMFREPVFFASRHARAGAAQIFSEFVATFGLLSVIWGCVRLRASTVPFAVGAYVLAPRHDCRRPPPGGGHFYGKELNHATLTCNSDIGNDARARGAVGRALRSRSGVTSVYVDRSKN